MARFDQGVSDALADLPIQADDKFYLNGYSWGAGRRDCQKNLAPESAVQWTGRRLKLYGAAWLFELTKKR